MLSVSNITKYYKDTLAVSNLSFEVNDGCIFGLLGENGAGKTTTFRIIMGLLDANSGTVTLNGEKIDYKVTDKIGFVTEERSLLTKMTVKEQLTFYGILKGMSNEKLEEKITYWLKRFKISEYENRKIKELSKGNQQKVQFISAILNDPVLLILDEPFTGLDPINVKMFKDVIMEMQNTGCSIIFSSHQMEHIEQFCEKLVILVKGKVVLEGNLKDIKKKYQKQNIFIQGEFDKEKVKKIKGVIDIKENANQYIVKIENDDCLDEVFNIVSKGKNITKFVVEEASLNEIFIDKVGICYEK